MTNASSHEGQTADEPEQPGDVVLSVKSVIEVAAAIAGSSALLSALMLYFGWVRTRVLFDRFGVPVDLLQFSTSDYILRSADVFFRPAIWSILVLAGLGAAATCARFVERRVPKPLWRWAVRGVLAAGTMVCAVVGVLGLFGVNPGWAAALMCVGGALLVMQYAVYRRAASCRLPPVVLVVGLLLTVAAMFWKVSIVAADTGSHLARDIQTGALSRPAATVFSHANLELPGQHDPSTPMSAEQQPWPFVYRGYKVLAYANNRWFLIQQRWQPGTPTIILPDDDAVRIEVTGRP